MTAALGWIELLSLPAWAPLSALPVPSRKLADVLQELAADVFVLAVPYGEDLVPDASRGPFLTAVLWAASSGVALRVIERQIEADDNASGLPPVELLPPGATSSYASILKHLNGAQLRPAESARYRFVPDGQFIARTIHTARWTYFFRGLDDNDAEVPFAIQYSLAGGTRRRPTSG